MRKEFLERIDARKDNTENKCDIVSYPFGAEEMLLDDELKKMEQTPSEDLQK